MAALFILNFVDPRQATIAGHQPFPLRLLKGAFTGWGGALWIRGMDSESAEATTTPWESTTTPWCPSLERGSGAKGAASERFQSR